MADEGGGEGEEIARAVIAIAADMDPLSAAMSGLPGMLMAPLTKTSEDVKNFIGDMLNNAIGGALSGHIGAAIAGVGQQVVGGVANTMRSVLTHVLGDTLGGGLASLTVAPVAGLAGKLFAGMGSAVDAAFGPIRRAIAADLTDLGQWVEKSISAESQSARFGAVLRASGEVAGWSANQLRVMAAQLSSTAGASTYGAAEIQKAQTALLAFGNVRGDRFTQTLAASMDLAAGKGMDLESAIHSLGMALQQPQTGFEHLRRSAGIFFSAQEQQAIKSAATVEDAQNLILQKVRSSFGGAAATMAGTTEGLLASMRNSWGGIGRSLGDILLPVTHSLAELGKPFIEWISGVVKPVFADAKRIVSDAMEAVKGFFDRNISTFKEWGQIGKEIVANVWGLVKDAFSGLFNVGGMDKVQSGFDSIKGSVTTVLRSVRDIASSWDNVKMAAVVAWDYVSDKAQGVWEEFRDAAIGAWDYVRDQATTVWEYLNEQPGVLWNAFMEKASAAWGAVVGYVQPVWDAAMNPAAALWDMAKELAVAAWDATKDAAASAWEWIQAQPHRLWDEFVDALPAAWDAVKGAASATWDYITGLPGQMWDALTDAAPGVWEAVKNIASATWDWLKGLPGELWDALEATAAAAWEAVKASAAQAWENLMDLMAGRMDRLWARFRQSGHDAIDALQHPIDTLFGGGAPRGGGAPGEAPAGEEGGGGGAAPQQGDDAAKRKDDRDRQREEDAARRAEERAQRQQERDEQRAKDLEKLKAAMAEARQKVEAARQDQLVEQLGQSTESAVDAAKGAGVRSIGFAEYYKEIQSHITSGGTAEKQLAEQQKQRIAAEKVLEEAKRTNEILRNLKPGGIGFSV
jgi:phage-related protein